MAKVKGEIESLLLVLLKAADMVRVKAWALHIAFVYAINRWKEMNPTEIWKIIEEVYEANLRREFPNQKDTAQSFRRASGDAFESFLEGYLNSNYLLQKEGIRAVKLIGEDFDRLIQGMGLRHPQQGRPLEPRDVDIFLQGMNESGVPIIFGAIFPKVSYAERIRADVPASRALMEKGLFSITVTLDARGELGTKDRPSVKRRTINEGGFHACYSLNKDTKQNGKIYVVDVHEKRLSKNRLISDIIHRWRQVKKDKRIYG